MSADSLAVLSRPVKLPSFAQHHLEVADRAEPEGWTFTAHLRHLIDMELEDRRVRIIERLAKSSHLPKDKTLATLDTSRFPVKIQRQLPGLCEGQFLRKAANVLAFGLPGRGRTHLCALSVTDWSGGGIRSSSHRPIVSSKPSSQPSATLASTRSYVAWTDSRRSLSTT